MCQELCGVRACALLRDRNRSAAQDFNEDGPKPSQGSVRECYRLLFCEVKYFDFFAVMDLKGIGYALGAAWLFGASTPAAKMLLSDISPIPLSALLYGGAALALSLYRLVRPGSREAQVSWRDLPLITGIIVFGGILGPILMLVGLSQVSALAGSLLLNLENPFTLIIAVGLMGEHLDRREALAAGAIMVGGALITFEPGYFGGRLAGAVEVTAACLSWAIDNNLTQRISLRDPVSVARIKTVAAASCLIVIAIAQSRGAVPPVRDLVWAVLVGTLCYGTSIVFDVRALRLLGAARESAYFATAPFVGGLLSIVFFRDVPTVAETIGAIFMMVGVMSLLRERHSHLHTHELKFHEHMHVHDTHHRHEHEDGVSEPHSHPHLHSGLTHDHPHVSDLHHHHSHRFI